MSFRSAGVTQANYISYLVSPYHVWFVDMGYPELDIKTFEDGEWALIQYLNSPTVPAMTRWQYVLTGIRKTEISPWWCRKYAENLDLEKKHVWAEIEDKERALEDETKSRERHDQDVANRRHETIMKNRGLVERISRNGLHEMNLRQISKHIPNHRFR